MPSWTPPLSSVVKLMEPPPGVSEITFLHAPRVDHCTVPRRLRRVREREGVSPAGYDILKSHPFLPRQARLLLQACALIRHVIETGCVSTPRPPLGFVLQPFLLHATETILPVACHPAREATHTPHHAHAPPPPHVACDTRNHPVLQRQPYDPCFYSTPHLQEHYNRTQMELPHNVMAGMAMLVFCVAGGLLGGFGLRRGRGRTG